MSRKFKLENVRQGQWLYFVSCKPIRGGFKYFVESAMVTNEPQPKPFVIPWYGQKVSRQFVHDLKMHKPVRQSGFLMVQPTRNRAQRIVDFLNAKII